MKQGKNLIDQKNNTVLKAEQHRQTEVSLESGYSFTIRYIAAYRKKNKLNLP